MTVITENKYFESAKELFIDLMKKVDEFACKNNINTEKLLCINCIYHICNKLPKTKEKVINIVVRSQNIKFDENDMLGDFNLLQRYGLIDVIINYIPEAQVAMFDSVLNMKSNDIMTNYYEPHAFVKEQLVKFAPLIHGWIESFLGAAESFMGEIDMNKVRNIVQKE